MQNNTITCKEFINTLTNKGFIALHLPSGKVRFSKGKQSWLYSPVDAVRYGHWFNDQACRYEAIISI